MPPPPDRAGSVHNGNGAADWTSLKAWASAIGIVGIPGAIAIFVVYIGTMEVPKLVRAMDTVIIEIRQTRDLVRENIDETKELTRMLERLCYNQAKDDNARDRCYSGK